MPNLDLMNVIMEIARFEGIPTMLHDDTFDTFDSFLTGEYSKNLHNILKTISWQISGVPSGLHGLFLK